MNLKNHTTFRPWMLTGDRGDSPTYAPSTTYKFNLKDVPPVTRRMANYIVGLIVTLADVVLIHTDQEGVFGSTTVSDADILAALFESAEVQQSMFGTPVSSNHFLGRYFGLFGFVANGMQPVCRGGSMLLSTTANTTRSVSCFIPLSALLGMKGHHTSQLACCYDRAQVVLRTAAQSVLPDVAYVTGGTLRVSAVVVPEPEVRLGPGTQFILYKQVASASGTTLTLDSFGNASTLEGSEQGAGIAMAVWMSKQRAYGGAGAVKTLEYLSAPWRDLQQTRHIEPFLIDWHNACGTRDVPLLSSSDSHETAGCLYDNGNYSGDGDLLVAANFLPIVSPHPFLETSKLQVCQGSATLNLKDSDGFSGEHVVAALQYHSWTPAKIEDVLRKAIDSGTMQAVWGTNDVVPSTKITNKQPAGSINPSKTRFFATTWVPKTVTPAPPTQ
jgi:hypothetical protein